MWDLGFQDFWGFRVFWGLLVGFGGLGLRVLASGGACERFWGVWL